MGIKLRVHQAKNPTMLIATSVSMIDRIVVRLASTESGVDQNSIESLEFDLMTFGQRSENVAEGSMLLTRDG